LLKRDFSDIVYRALANYFDVQTINSNIKAQTKKLVYYASAQSTSVLAGQSEVITITPPAGKVYKIRLMWVKPNPPGGATTGTNELRIYQKNMVWQMGIMLRSSYNVAIEIKHTKIISADIIKDPEDTQGLRNAIDGYLITNSYPLEIKYTNNTDADNSEIRNYYFVFEEFDELS